MDRKYSSEIMPVLGLTALTEMVAKANVLELLEHVLIANDNTSRMAV